MSKKENKLGEKMKKLRKKEGISQDGLSKKADLAFYTIAKIESGSTPNPSIDTVKKIANALNVTVDELVK